ncbi:hypothetical protein MBLNU457_6436t1 [Dothideomycetes sp. NU457]
MSTLMPIKVWGHWGAPNPWKVKMLLEMLSIPHEWHLVEVSDVKGDAYLKVNPNGRLPTIQDPNTGITLCEMYSGAIFLYIVDTYDKEHKISYASGPEKYLTQQWLAFQISGQAPYFGQATWFLRFHLEKIPSAIDRYVKEILRVLGVIELGLERNGTGWLVGDKLTYADLSFLTWAHTGEGVLKQIGRFDEVKDDYPLYTSWLSRISAYPAIAKALEEIGEQRKAHGLP